MSKIEVNEISKTSTGSEIAVTSDVALSNGLKTDTISEKTADTGVTIDGVLIKDGTIESTYLDASTTETVQTLTSTSGVLTINMNNGKAGTITLTENITDIDFTNIPTSGQAEFTLHITQHASSAKTVSLKKVTINGGSEFLARTVDGSDYTMSVTLSTVDILVFTFVNGGAPFVESSKKIETIAQLEGYSDLLFELNFNDTSCYSGTGSAVYDLSGNNFNFTVTGSPTWNTDGNGDSNFDFDDASEYLISNSNSGVSGTSQALTVSALVSEETTGSFNAVLGQTYDTQDVGLAFVSLDGQLGTDIWSPQGFEAPAHSQNTKLVVTWVLPTLADVIVASNASIYINTTSQNLTNYGTGTFSGLTNNPMTVGGWKPNRADMSWGGKIYGIAVWNAALTSQQITDNYNNYWSQKFTI